MRSLLFRVPLFLLSLSLAIPAFAGIQFLNTEDPCEGLDPLECMAMVSASGVATSISTCTDNWGCPQCGMNQSETNSLCFKIFANWGVCTCTPAGITTDKYGRKQPRCITKGSCHYRA